MRIGQILREARSAQRLTITACSTRLAIPRSRYANIEEGKASCTVAELLDIEDFLSLPPDRVRDALAGHIPPGSPQSLFAYEHAIQHYLCTFRLWSSKSPIASSMLWSSDLVSRTM